MTAVSQAGPTASIAESAGTNEDGEAQPDKAEVGAPDSGQFPGPTAEWLDVLHRLHHDIRTPLNAVIGFSDIMQLEMHGPLGHRRYREYATHIRESGDLLLRAAEETLVVTALLANTTVHKRGPVCLRTMLDKVWRKAGLGSAIGQRPISLDCSAEVHAAPRVFEQALLFVLRHMDSIQSGPGAIVVSTSTSPAKTKLVVGCRVHPARPQSDFVRAAGANRSLALAAILFEFDGGTFAVTHEAEDRLIVCIEFDRPAQRDQIC